MRRLGWAVLAAGITLTAAGQAGDARTGDAPELKEGLWLLQTVTTTLPGNKKSVEAVTLCRNHAYDAYANAMALMQKDCTVKRNFQGDTMSLDGTCTVKGSTVLSKGSMKMSGDTAAHSETHTTYTPALRGVVESSLVQDQTWLSSCPAGMKPGDQRTADPGSMHLKEK
jgi:hypothetical protein